MSDWNHSSPWQVQDLGLGVGLLEEPWALPCWATAPFHEHECQGWERQARLDKVIASLGIHACWVWHWVGLS